MTPPSQGIALELIRAATSTAHRALERGLEIARPEADEAAYLRYLEALFGWLDPLEEALWAGPWPELVAAAGRAGKARWIEADLRARGHDGATVAQLPRLRALPPLDSVAQYFGVAYVVEGAQLGGQLLLRRLGPRLTPLPVRWLEGYGDDTAKQWRSFVCALRASLPARADAEIAAQSARATFELVQAWFSLRGVA